MNANVVIVDFIARPRQRLREGAKILEMNMPDDGRRFHRWWVSHKCRSVDQHTG
jgi:hypothetical protein